jgi:hypothetical protein
MLQRMLSCVRERRTQQEQSFILKEIEQLEIGLMPEDDPLNAET